MAQKFLRKRRLGKFKGLGKTNKKYRKLQSAHKKIPRALFLSAHIIPPCTVAQIFKLRRLIKKNVRSQL